MAGSLPPISVVLDAVENYLDIAYGDQRLPVCVANTVRQLRTAGEAEFYYLPVWERGSEWPPARLSVRLGNRIYPHMKLTLERRYDDLGYAFRVDAHCRHVLQPVHLTEELAELLREDEAIAACIEAAWEAAGISPTAGRSRALADSQALSHILHSLS